MWGIGDVESSKGMGEGNMAMFMNRGPGSRQFRNCHLGGSKLHVHASPSRDLSLVASISIFTSIHVQVAFQIHVSSYQLKSYILLTPALERVVRSFIHPQD